DSWNHRMQAFDLPDWKFTFKFRDLFCPKWIGAVDTGKGPVLCVVDTNNARLCFHQPDRQQISTFEFGTRRFPVFARVVDADTLEVSFEGGTSKFLDIESIVWRPWWLTRLEKPISVVRDSRGFIYASDFGRH